MEEAPDRDYDVLPAWGLPAGKERQVVPGPLPAPVTPEWAFGGATGAGVRVCVLDSGIEAGHPLVGAVERAVTVADDGEETRIVEDAEGDDSGHGTACAGIIRSLAPEVSLASARVLGPDINGRFVTLRAGIAWAIDEGYDVCNLSLSVRSREFALDLCELADRAAFQGTMLVCSAHNVPVAGYPWRFASVVSVGEPRRGRPLAALLQPRAARRVLRARRQRPDRLDRRRHHPRHRQQLRYTARHRATRAHPLQTPAPDAVRTQDRPLPHGGQCRRLGLEQ